MGVGLRVLTRMVEVEYDHEDSLLPSCVLCLCFYELLHSEFKSYLEKKKKESGVNFYPTVYPIFTLGLGTLQISRFSVSSKLFPLNFRSQNFVQEIRVVFPNVFCF